MMNLMYNSRLTTICGLLGLVLLSWVFSSSGFASDVFGENTTAAFHAGSDSSSAVTQIIAPGSVSGFFFDFENIPERDPDPDGNNFGVGKGTTRVSFTRCLLGATELSLTKSTLACCTASIQKRMVPPLFLLHHSWKYFFSLILN